MQIIRKTLGIQSSEMSGAISNAKNSSSPWNGRLCEVWASQFIQYFLSWNLLEKISALEYANFPLRVLGRTESTTLRRSLSNTSKKQQTTKPWKAASPGELRRSKRKRLLFLTNTLAGISNVIRYRKDGLLWFSIPSFKLKSWENK